MMAMMMRDERRGKSAGHSLKQTDNNAVMSL